MALIKRPPEQADKPFLLRMMIYGDGSEGKTTNLASFLKNPLLKQVIWIAADATTCSSLNYVDDVWGVELKKGQLIIAEPIKESATKLEELSDKGYLALHRPLLGGYPAYDAFDGSIVSLKKPSDYGQDTLIVIDGLSSYNVPIFFKGNNDFEKKQNKKMFDSEYIEHKKLLHTLFGLIAGANCHVALTAHTGGATDIKGVETYHIKKYNPNLLVRSLINELTKDFNWVLVARKTVSATGKAERWLCALDKDYFTKYSFNEIEFEKAREEFNKGKPQLEHISLSRLPCDLTHPIYPFLKGE